MRRTPVGRLVVLALAATVLTWGVLRAAESRGATVLPVPVLATGVVLVIAGVVLWLGWGVRQFTHGKRPGLDPLLAARTVVLATAAAHTGALLTGWYLGHVLLVAADLGIEARREVAVASAVAAVATVVLAVVGLVVERWCEVTPPEDPPGGVGAASPPDGLSAA